jgi:hypothetical protein
MQQIDSGVGNFLSVCQFHWEDNDKGGKVALNISTEQHMPMFCGSRFQSDIVRWKNDSCLCWILQDLDILPLSLSSQWNWHTLRNFPTPLSLCWSCWRQSVFGRSRTTSDIIYNLWRQSVFGRSRSRSRRNKYLSTKTTSSLSRRHFSFGQTILITASSFNFTELNAEANCLTDWNKRRKIYKTDYVRSCTCHLKKVKTIYRFP